MTVVYAVLGVALLGAGAAAMGIGGWGAITGRRPAWLSEQTIRPGVERAWGFGIGLAGLGLALFGAGDLGLISPGFGLAAFVLVLCGVGLIVIATPRTRRSP